MGGRLMTAAIDIDVCERADDPRLVSLVEVGNTEVDIVLADDVRFVKDVVSTDALANVDELVAMEELAHIRELPRTDAEVTEMLASLEADSVAVNVELKVISDDDPVVGLAELEVELIIELLKTDDVAEDFKPDACVEFTEPAAREDRVPALTETLEEDKITNEAVVCPRPADDDTLEAVLIDELPGMNRFDEIAVLLEAAASDIIVVREEIDGMDEDDAGNKDDVVRLVNGPGLVGDVETPTVVESVGVPAETSWADEVS